MVKKSNRPEKNNRIQNSSNRFAGSKPAGHTPENKRSNYHKANNPPRISAVPAVPTVPVYASEPVEVEAGPPDRLEGRNPILEALRAGRAINKLWILKKTEKPDPTLARIMNLAKDAGAVIIETDRVALDNMATSFGHQGVIAQVASHEYVDLDECIDQVLAKDEVPFIIILDSLQEGYNLGAVLRIADAAGVHAIVIPERRSVGLDATVAKASAGSIEYVPVARVGNLVQTVINLKKRGFWIAGTDASATQDYTQADWKGPLAIVTGSEGDGISPGLLKHCDFLVSIPMHGSVNSLNAAVATGIIVFEASRQRNTK